MGTYLNNIGRPLLFFSALQYEEPIKSCISNRSCRATNLHKNINQGLPYTYSTAPKYFVSSSVPNTS